MVDGGAVDGGGDGWGGGSGGSGCFGAITTTHSGEKRRGGGRLNWKVGGGGKN